MPFCGLSIASIAGHSPEQDIEMASSSASPAESTLHAVSNCSAPFSEHEPPVHTARSMRIAAGGAQRSAAWRKEHERRIAVEVTNFKEISVTVRNRSNYPMSHTRAFYST